MQLFTTLSPTDLPPRESIDVAVVIDVLRATSVVTTALAAGANEVITCRQVEDARTHAASLSTQPLLCGERGCRLIDGFDLGNSPAEYTSQQVVGRTLILTTTNGTRAIVVAQSARTMVLASFLNLSVVVDAIIDANSVLLVCAGTEGRVTGEDTLLAGAIVDQCVRRSIADCSMCDASAIALHWWRSSIAKTNRSGTSLSDVTTSALSSLLADSIGGRNLIRVGYREDIDRCAAIDSLTCVPRRVSRTPTVFAAS